MFPNEPILNDLARLRADVDTLLKREWARADQNVQTTDSPTFAALNVNTSGAGTGEIRALDPNNGPALSGEVHNADTANFRIGVQITHTSTATPAGNFGISYRTQLHSDNNTTRVASDVITRWATATDASYKAQTAYFVYDASSSREYLRGESNGSAAMLGFYGHTAVVQPAAPVTLADVIAIIRGCGLSA